MFEDTPTSSIVLIAILFLCLWITIAYFFIRWVLSIKRQLWNQKAQINVLIKIAEKLGVPKDEIDLIEKRNNTKSDHFID